MELYTLFALSIVLSLWTGGVCGALLMRAIIHRAEPDILPGRIVELEHRLSAWQMWYKSHQPRCGELARMHATAEEILETDRSLALSPREDPFDD